MRSLARTLVAALMMSWLLVLAGAAHAQEAPPTYPINKKTEPLLASVKRRNLFLKGEELHILQFNPARLETPVCRLDKEGLTEKVDKMPGSQLRLAYAISTAIGEEEKLDAKAKKELASALAAYKIHTFDDLGMIIRSRLPKTEGEALQQINRDVEGAHHFRKLADYAKGCDARSGLPRESNPGSAVNSSSVPRA